MEQVAEWGREVGAKSKSTDSQAGVHPLHLEQISSVSLINYAGVTHGGHMGR